MKCRRKDITTLFLDTGVSSDLYSFIEQGRIDKIVNATDAERRTLIDEAAGISRYKARREEAQGRLQAAAAHPRRQPRSVRRVGRRGAEQLRQQHRRRVRVEQTRDLPRALQPR